MRVRPVILAVAVGVVVSILLSVILYEGPVRTLAGWVVLWARPTAWSERFYAAEAAVYQLMLTVPGVLAAVLVYAWLRNRWPTDRENRWDIKGSG